MHLKYSWNWKKTSKSSLFWANIKKTKKTPKKTHWAGFFFNRVFSNPGSRRPSSAARAPSSRWAAPAPSPTSSPWSARYASPSTACGEIWPTVTRGRRSRGAEPPRTAPPPPPVWRARRWRSCWAVSWFCSWATSCIATAERLRQRNFTRDEKRGGSVLDFPKRNVGELSQIFPAETWGSCPRFSQEKNAGNCHRFSQEKRGGTVPVFPGETRGTVPDFPRLEWT